MILKNTPGIETYPAYNNHRSLPDVLYSLKSFKCMFAATNQQANDLPETETSGKE